MSYLTPIILLSFVLFGCGAQIPPELVEQLSRLKEESFDQENLSKAKSNEENQLLLGQRNFDPPLTITVNNKPENLITGDINNDGRDDIVTGTYSSGLAAIRTGNADKTFGNSPNVSACNMQPSLGDINNDGNLDIVGSHFHNGTLCLRLGNGDGTFTTIANEANTASSRENALVDINRDGNLDIITPTSGSNNYMEIKLGNGDGTFTSLPPFTAIDNHERFEVGDYNGDLYPDFAIGDDPYNGRVFLNNGDDTFSDTGLVMTYLVRAQGDFDNDGDLDIFTLRNIGTHFVVYLNNGDGSFIDLPNTALGASARTTRAADMDNDGNIDLVMLISSTKEIWTIWGQGDGTFDLANPTKTGITFAGNIAALQLGDFNGDTLKDFVVSENGSGASLQIIFSR